MVVGLLQENDGAGNSKCELGTRDQSWVIRRLHSFVSPTVFIPKLAENSSCWKFWGKF
tara:strand:+ start:278 stop:451 length:174 start_codon:yes stop_codon:yes gene_type:complete